MARRRDVPAGEDERRSGEPPFEIHRGAAGADALLAGDARAGEGAILSRDLSAALEAGETIAALPSRERIRAFLRYASGMFRNIFLSQQGLDNLADIGGEEEKREIQRLAGALKRSYARMVLPLLDRSSMLVDRNVNAKIVICDLVNKMFVL